MIHLQAWECLDLSDRQDESDLIGGFVRGERAAFERVVALYHRRVTRLAWRLLGWNAEVDDVVQDVFVAVLQQRHKFKGNNDLWPWIATITINSCRSRLRRRFLHLRWLRQRRREEPQVESADAKSRQDESSAKVRAAIRVLPPRDREVIVLYYLEEYSAAQISEILRMTENAVDVRLHRARKRLKELLEDFASDQ